LYKGAVAQSRLAITCTLSGTPTMVVDLLMPRITVT